MSKSRTVNQGECIESIALEEGFFPSTIWNHPLNIELRNSRKQHDVLNPGDALVIPEREPKEVNRGTDQKHRFVRRGVPSKFVLRLLKDGKPRSSLDYSLDIDGHLEYGQTDGDGVLRHLIPANAKKGLLIIRSTGEQYNLSFSHLDPISTPTGLAARLHNLGYLPTNAPTPEQLSAGLSAFQNKIGLTVSGNADGETLQRLITEHGS